MAATRVTRGPLWRVMASCSAVSMTPRGYLPLSVGLGRLPVKRGGIIQFSN